MQIQIICEYLKTNGFCSTEEEFSLKFLRRSPTYFGSTKAKKIPVSLSAVVILNQRLKHLAACIEARGTSADHRESKSDMATVCALLLFSRELEVEIERESLKGFRATK